MTFRIRALLAALIVVAVAGAGALFIAHRTAAVAQQDYDVATTGDVRDLFASVSSGNPQLAGLAVRKLEETYYKPVDPDTIVAGEQSALRAYLKSKNVANVTLPTGAGGVIPPKTPTLRSANSRTHNNITPINSGPQAATTSPKRRCTAS